MSLSVLGLSGSLRRGSTNTALLRAIGAALPDGVTLQIHDYGDVPLFNSDIEPRPAAVDALRSAIEAADAVVIATPEYNHSVPGVLKNAVDWASRPAYRSPFAGKPTAVVSAAASFVGGARAQQHMKTILLGMGVPVYIGPDVLVGKVFERMMDGELTDEATLKVVARFGETFADWVAGR